MDQIDTILSRYSDPRDSLIAVLQEMQQVFGYLSKDTLDALTVRTGIPAADLYGVATFYKQFRLAPLGKYHILVCAGTACHVNNSDEIAQAVEDTLQTAQGRATDDGLFSWEKVACLGCCGLSPVMMINGHAYGRLTREKVTEIIERIKQAEPDAGGAL